MDFTKPGVIQQIARKTKEGVDLYSKSKRNSRHSVRISPSTLGEECAAKNWYAFRWAKSPEDFDGRMCRLFERGDIEEPRIVESLKGSGWNVWEFNPQTGKQYEVFDLAGHLYGKLDGIGNHPVITNGVNLLLEFKSYNTKRFSQLCNTDKPLKVQDPKYYGQIVIYMMYYDLPACLFYPVNKNDDDIAPMVILRDDSYARDLLRKGETIVNSKVRPARIAESRSFYKCKMCHFADVCHDDAPVLVNCRSCVNATAVEGGVFYCESWNGIIPKDQLPLGCGEHKPIK